MAELTIKSVSLRRYGTDRQSELLAMLNDSHVQEHVNEIINEKLRELDYIPINMSDYKIWNEKDYPGRLRDSVKIGPKQITWSTPYAHYVWTGSVYGPNIPIFAKGANRKRDENGRSADEPIGFYSPKGSTKVPKDQKMNYSLGSDKSRWVEKGFKESGRIINQAITNYLKKECRKRGLNK